MNLIAELGAGPREVGRARRVLARTLADSGVDGDHADVAVLLTSELVTNAIRHGRPPVTVLLDVNRRAVRVEVRDLVPGAVVARRAPTDALGGRGLHLVESLADRWGCRDTREGKRIWFEVRTG